MSASYQLFNQIENFYEIQLGGHAIEGGLDACFFKSCSFNHSKMADVQTSEVDAKLAPNVGK
jgi:hypothetical protein